MCGIRVGMRGIEGGGEEGNQGGNLRIGGEIMKAHFNYQYLIRMTLLALV